MSSNKVSFNQLYLRYLNKYPLLTKSITAGVLAGLNESIVTAIANDYQEMQIDGLKDDSGEPLKIKHPFNKRVPLMAFFGFTVSAPISHYGYMYLNKIFKQPLTPTKRVLQILLSLSTITPILCTCMVSYISILGAKPGISFQSFVQQYYAGGLNGIKEELDRLFTIVKVALKTSLFRVLKASWATSSVALAIAQTYLSPNHWVVFFNVVYFVLGTYQNSMVKKRNKERSKAVDPL
ncbi:BA75_04501T0 [Komagataella pastoris]|uniref:BA75_04501T0 n=1 Tax=Komagataella pastoris TaxID=4922 RepID=A0A1B2JIZ9_PICPA|nr:BA75_04501T0 [Komagataella pastoris]